MKSPPRWLGLDRTLHAGSPGATSNLTARRVTAPGPHWVRRPNPTQRVQQPSVRHRPNPREQRRSVARRRTLWCEPSFRKPQVPSGLDNRSINLIAFHQLINTYVIATAKKMCDNGAAQSLSRQNCTLTSHSPRNPRGVSKLGGGGEVVTHPVG